MFLVTLSCRTFIQPATPVETAAPTSLRIVTTAPTLSATLPVGGISTKSPAQPTSPPNSQTATPQPEAQSTVAPSSATPVSCSSNICTYTGTFLLARPVGPGGRDTIETTYRFGVLKRGSIGAHHGVDFLNSTGNPVAAAADGKVVVAGNDLQTVYALRTNTYGNLIIIKHKLPGVSEPVFTLYAQLSEMDLKVGDQVTAGQIIGKVGSSGSVKGSTLHFEVRVGENTYQAARNPELWLKPLTDDTGQLEGALAGRVLNNQGQPVPLDNIIIKRMNAPANTPVTPIYLKTYVDRGLVGQSPWEESFALGDLPAGSYQVSFRLNNKPYQQVLQVQSGQLTIVTFQVP